MGGERQLFFLCLSWLARAFNCQYGAEDICEILYLHVFRLERFIERETLDLSHRFQPHSSCDGINYSLVDQLSLRKFCKLCRLWQLGRWVWSLI